VHRAVRFSVTLPDEDVAFLDAYAHAKGLRSRSAALQRAVSLLRAAELGVAYEQAWADWDDRDEAALWERTAGDGLAY
jgi:Arc/MetJ-type ribon-helix-helix transcriptional regulator